jgi:hypothetical protein
MLDGLGHDAADNPLGLFDGVPDDVACRSNVVDQTDALSSERHIVFTTTGQDLRIVGASAGARLARSSHAALAGMRRPAWRRGIFA